MKKFWIGWGVIFGLLAVLTAEFDKTPVVINIIHIFFGYHLALAAFAGLFWNKRPKKLLTRILLWSLFILTLVGGTIILLATILMFCAGN